MIAGIKETCWIIAVNSNFLLLSLFYLMLPALGSITIVQGSKKLAQECYKHFTKDVENAAMSIDLIEKFKSHVEPEIFGLVEVIFL